MPRAVSPHLPRIYPKVYQLKNLLTRKGNLDRANSFLMKLIRLLKIALLYPKSKHFINSFFPNNQLRKHAERSSFRILDKCLSLLLPAFILRRTVVAGRVYQLPVPVSPHRASFMACDWLRKAAFRDTKNALTVPYLLAREISVTLNKKGTAWKSLRSYIKVAIDQRPFIRYVRKKRRIISRSKTGKAGQKLFERFRRGRRRVNRKKSAAKYRSRQYIYKIKKYIIKRKQKTRSKNKKRSYYKNNYYIKNNRKKF